MVKTIRYALWIKTWLLHLVKLWLSNNLSRFKLIIGKKSQIIEIVNRAPVDEHVSFAVVALFPVQHSIYTVSIQNLISGLRSNGLHIVLMLNGPVDSTLRSFFTKANCTVITRRNIGRDFGAYKDGVLWLDEEVGLEKIERLLLINDTLLWINNGTEYIAKTLQADWSALFLNLEVHTHAQSFFLSFSNRVLKNKEILKFWKRYVPTKYRRLAILNGEIKLSEVLIKEGFRCKSLVNPSLFESLNHNSDNQKTINSLLGSLTLSEMGGITPPGVTSGRKIPMIEINPFHAVEESKTVKSLDDSQIMESLVRLFSQFCNSHAPHRIGLHLYVIFGFPLKTDIYKCYTLSEIYRCISFKNPEYANELIDFLSGKSQQFMEGSRANIKRRKLGEI